MLGAVGFAVAVAAAAGVLPCCRSRRHRARARRSTLIAGASFSLSIRLPPRQSGPLPCLLFALLPFFALPFLPLRCAGGRDMNGGFFRRGVVVPIGKVELQRSMIEVYTLHSTLYTLKLPAKQPTPPHRRMLPAVAHVKNIRRG